jgi:hypothetical protein
MVGAIAGGVTSGFDQSSTISVWIDRGRNNYLTVRNDHVGSAAFCPHEVRLAILSYICGTTTSGSSQRDRSGKQRTQFRLYRHSTCDRRRGFIVAFSIVPSAPANGSELPIEAACFSGVIAGSDSLPLFGTAVESMEVTMGRGILLWLLGVPIPIIILLALIWH